MNPHLVLDLAGETGAFCSQLLAGLGMDVAKIEPSPTGLSNPCPENVPNTEKSLRLAYLNRGKRTVNLNIDTVEGRSRFREVARDADVVVESFRPGHLSNIGLDYAELSRLNPGLVMASITGFGQYGPYRDLCWSDIVAQAMGGQMFVNGEPGSPPLKLPDAQSYMIASLFAATGVLLALRDKRNTGVGQHLDISLQECVAASLDHVLPQYFGTGETAVRRGSLHWNNAFRIFPCRDGQIAASLFLQWDTLVEWLNCEGTGRDLAGYEWKDPERRRQGVDHVIEVLESFTRTRSAEDLQERAQLMGFPWARVNTPSDVAASAQFKMRGFFVRETIGLMGTLEFPGFPAVLKRPLSKQGTPESSVKPVKADSRSPLDGIRVLDFTRVLAGPYATRILADFGAEVIKVQYPGSAEQDDFGKAYYRYWNRNKRSVAIDLSRPGGVDVMLRLVAKSDVLVENFSPRVMANLGLEYATVRRSKPDIVMVSLSAMGQTGPQSGFTGYGPTVHALSGLSCLTAYAPDKPLGPGTAYADHVSGVMAALAAIAALEHRENTGEGQHVDVSETEAVCALLGASLASGTQPMGNRSADHAPSACYRCRGEDAWCVIDVENEEQWQSFVAVLDSPGWAMETRFNCAADRLRHSEALDRLVESWTRKHTPEQVMGILQESGIPAGKVLDAAGLAEDPQLSHRGFFVQDTNAGGPGLTVDGNPIRLSWIPARCVQPAPSLNQDADYVFKELLGMGTDEIERLRKTGVIP